MAMSAHRKAEDRQADGAEGNKSRNHISLAPFIPRASGPQLSRVCWMFTDEDTAEAAGC